MVKVRCERGQTVWDLALMVDGNIDNIISKMKMLGIQSFDEDLTNRVFEFEMDTTNPFVREIFMNSNNVVTGEDFLTELETLDLGAFNNDFDEGFDIET